MPDDNATHGRSRPLEWMASLFASAAIGLSVVALVGWTLSDPDVAAFGAYLVPMAPSTAALFLTLAILVLLRGLPTRSSRSRRLILVAAGAATVAAAALLLLSSLGITLGLEHLGLRISGRRAGVLIGHMSPLTAAAFVMGGSSLLLANGSGPRQVLRVEAASFLAAIVALVGGIAALAYAMGGPLLYGSGIIPPALPTALGFVALGGALWATCQARAPRRAGPVARRERGPYVPLALVAVLGVGVVSVAVIQYRQYERSFRRNAAAQLEAVAELKLDQLIGWRQERMLDAVAFFRNPSFFELVQELLADPGDPAPRRRLLPWLASVQAGFQYDRVAILDRSGHEQLLAVGDAPWTPPSALGDQVRRVVQSGEPELLQLDPPSPGREPALIVLAPVAAGVDPGEAIAVLAIHIDPHVYMYPLLRRWPVPGLSGETLLVRRDGDVALILNDPKDPDRGAVRLPISKATAAVPSVMAVEGAEGVVEGESTDGTQVTAAIHAVPGTGWSLVVQMPTGELNAALTERLWWTLGVVGVLLLGLGTSARFAWHLREEAHLRQLASAEERYRSLFNSIRDAILVADTERRIIDCNPAFEELFGWRRDEIRGEGTVSVYESPEEHRRMGERIRSHMDVPSFIHVISYRKRSGATFPGETNVFNLRNSEGEIVGFIGLIRDVTERLRAEEQRDRLQARLFETDKMETVGRLAGGVAHDFNNALTAILGHVELAISQVQGEGQLRADLEEVRTAAKRSAKVVRQLLAFARRQVILPEVLDLNDTVGGLVEMLSTLVGRDVELRWAPGEDLWPVRMDPAQLEQLLADLVLNSRDAIQGSGTICIRTGNVTIDQRTSEAIEGARPGPYVVLAVSDDGVGIDGEALEKVFDPFFSTKPTAEGGGLGLAAVHGIVRQHNGFVKVESEPGQGATFTIHLPPAAGRAPSSESPAREAGAVVDDEG